MSAPPPHGSTIDRRLAWSRLAASMFGDDADVVEIDGYRVLDVLGRGAMGTVYLAHDPTLEREVAIKLVAGADGAQTLREARALAKVTHPGVVTVHHVGDFEGLVYIVMERLRGEDLRDWQARRAWPELVRMYVELARALGCAHRHAVVHRDFKPDNVRVDEHGRGRILDFGLAGAPDAAPSGGTPAYVAPEQLLGAPADARMDQFAWAVALAEALTGTRPRAGTMPSWPTGPDAPPSRVSTVLARALQAQPNDRWPSIDAAADALEHAVAVGAEQRGRMLLLDKLEATWLAGVLQPIRRASVQLRPVFATTSPARPVELAALDHVLAHAGFVVVRGAPGSGKTTTLLDLAELAHDRARRDPSALLPVVLNLSSWSTWPTGSLADWLIDALGIEYGIPHRVAARWLDDDALLLLLDGLDEVAPARRAGCITAIAALRAEHFVGLVVASRSSEDPLDAELRPTIAVELQPLPTTEVHAALEHAGRPELVAALGRSPELSTLLHTPLLVDMTLRGFEDPPELATQRDPEVLLRVLVRRLVERQLAPLDEAHRSELRTRLGQLARLLERQGLSELWLERMQPTWLARAWQRAVHGLVSVVLVAVLLGSLVAITLIPAAGVRVGLASAALAGPVLAMFIGSVAGLRRIDPIERLTWSWSRARANGRRALAQGLSLAAVVSLIATVVWGLGQPLSAVLAIAFGNFVGYAVLSTLMLAVLGGLDAELVATRSRINEGMHASGRNMLLVWALVFSLLAIPLLGVTLVAESLEVPDVDAEAIELWRAAPRRFFALIGLCAASTLGLVAALLRGGFAVVQHLVLRAMLALAGELPFRVGRVLDAGRARSLLRRVGGGHAFVHGALQAELARAGIRAD
jgi:serine/threonine protein kinase